ncbi:MAG TPA: lipocalin-like domain-containing protein [Alphaproteobacteria bacterium]|nr:lipocalin-like domain-containing protein [Alphaproteobacteria bacterium]
MSASSLAGAWRLESFVFTDDGGGTHTPLGESPHGLVLITPDNYLSLSFMADGRQAFAESSLLGGSADERAAAAASYVSFGGPFRVEGDEVVVEVAAAFHPNWAGSVQRRRFRLEGGTLTLMTAQAIPVDGKNLMGQAVLRRAAL